MLGKNTTTPPTPPTTPSTSSERKSDVEPGGHSIARWLEANCTVDSIQCIGTSPTLKVPSANGVGKV